MDELLHACLDEIALEGLQGCSWARLWHVMSRRLRARCELPAFCGRERLQEVRPALQLCSGLKVYLRKCLAVRSEVRFFRVQGGTPTKFDHISPEPVPDCVRVQMRAAPWRMRRRNCRSLPVHSTSAEAPGLPRSGHGFRQIKSSNSPRSRATVYVYSRRPHCDTMPWGWYSAIQKCRARNTHSLS